MKKVMVFMLMIIALVACEPSNGAEFQMGVDTEKTLNCQNAMERTDGTTLTLAEIEEVIFTVSGQGFSQDTVMVGGCQPVQFDLTQLPGPGVYDQVGVTKDTGGQVSAVSPSTPFTLLAPIPAPPNPPVILE